MVGGVKAQSPPAQLVRLRLVAAQLVQKRLATSIEDNTQLRQSFRNVLAFPLRRRRGQLRRDRIAQDQLGRLCGGIYAPGAGSDQVRRPILVARVYENPAPATLCLIAIPHVDDVPRYLSIEGARLYRRIQSVEGGAQSCPSQRAGCLGREFKIDEERGRGQQYPQQQQ